MTIKGTITQVSKSSFMIHFKKFNKDYYAIVPYSNCGFCVDDSVVIKGHIYNSRYLKKDFTYGTMKCIAAKSIILS